MYGLGPPAIPSQTTRGPWTTAWKPSTFHSSYYLTRQCLRRLCPDSHPRSTQCQSSGCHCCHVRSRSWWSPVKEGQGTVELQSTLGEKQLKHYTVWDFGLCHTVKNTGTCLVVYSIRRCSMSDGLPSTAQSITIWTMVKTLLHTISISGEPRTL